MRCSQNRKTLPKQIFYFFSEFLLFFRVRIIYIVVGTRTTFNYSKSKNKHISITGNFYLFSMISFKYCNFLAEVLHHQKLCPVTPKQCQEVTSPLSEKYLPLQGPDCKILEQFSIFFRINILFDKCQKYRTFLLAVKLLDQEVDYVQLA